MIKQEINRLYKNVAMIEMLEYQIELCKEITIYDVARLVADIKSLRQ